MRSGSIKILVFILAASLSGCLADYSSKPVCRVEKDRLIFKFDVRWNKEEKREISYRYDLDSTLINAAYSGQKEITFDSITWKIRKKNFYFIELSKKFDDNAPGYLSKNDILLVEENWLKQNETSIEPEVSIGVNLFEDTTAFRFSDSVAVFTLTNHKKAEEVYLCGSFNDWNRRALKMEKGSEGWTTSVKLKPGKYTYKYLVDGKWINDPENNQREKDALRGQACIFFIPNHVFTLDGFPDARKVVLTGNRLSWNTTGIKMSKYNGRWNLPVYLSDGTFVYKFIADGTWMTDPNNPDLRRDANGNQNSFLSIGNRHRFNLEGYQNARYAVLSGSFNGWSGNELMMSRTPSGWTIDYALPSGNYEYKFIVDGAWVTDKANQFAMNRNIDANSFIAINPNHTFILKGYQEAKDVLVSGSFNGWNKDSFHMIRSEGNWILPFYLKPGKYIYKFIIDGNWILDPGNELFEPNEYGTNNSVLWIEQ